MKGHTVTGACCVVFVKSFMPGFVDVSGLQSDLVYIVLVELYKEQPSTHTSLGKRGVFCEAFQINLCVPHGYHTQTPWIIAL